MKDNLSDQFYRAAPASESESVFDLNQIKLLTKENFQQFLDETDDQHEEALPEQTYETKVQEVLQKAAVSGKVQPADLLPGDLESTKPVLAILVHDFDVFNSPVVQWQLKLNTRLRVLQQLIDANSLQTVLGKTLPPTDSYGEMLRKIIREGTQFAAEGLNEEQLKAAATALETTDRLLFPKPSVDSILQRIPNTSILEEYAGMVRNFIGREPELQALHRFLTSDIQPNFKWSGLVLRGVGGVGKSALLAKFITLSQTDATIVVLDFDRPGIDPNDTVWLEREVSKQVGFQYEQLRSELQQSRRQADERTVKGMANFTPVRGAQSQISDETKSIILDTAKAIFDHKIEHKPLLLILDTMEEVYQRSRVPRLVEWIHGLAETLRRIKLKVIFSGRLYDAAFTQIREVPQVVEELSIGEFDDKIAMEFITRFGLSAFTATKIIENDAVPKRPLELKLLASLILSRELSENEFLKDLAADKGSPKEMFVGVVYRRVLQRLGDDENVRRLAYPGLLLRYLTSDIIENVLAQELGLTLEPGTKDAALLLKTLAKYSWLCNTDERGRVWHSKELRRSMIHYMIAREPEKVKRIRAAAIRYFRSLGTKEYWAESLYHELMAMEGPESAQKLKTEELAEAWDYLQTDIADLPKTAATILRFAAGEKVPDAEVFCLPVYLLKDRYHATGARLVDQREYFSAYQLFARLSKRERVVLPDSEKADRTYPYQWQTELLFALAEWKKLTQEFSADYRWNYSSSVFQMIDALYPAITVMDKQSVFQLASLAKFQECMDEILTNPRRYVEGYHNETALNRLFIICILGYRYELLTQMDLAALRKSLPQLPEDLFNPMETFRQLEMLRQLHPTGVITIHLGQIKINTRWLEWLQMQPSFELAPESASFVKELLQLLRSASSLENGQTSKVLLSQLGGMSKYLRFAKGIRLQLKQLTNYEQILELTTGPQLFLRDACRYAVLSAFKTEADFKKLAVLLQSSLEIVLADLEPERFTVQVAANPELALEPFIEVIDRSWAMDAFLTAARKAKPRHKKLKLVHEALLNWQEAYRHYVEGLSRDITG